MAPRKQAAETAAPEQRHDRDAEFIDDLQSQPAKERQDYAPKPKANTTFGQRAKAKGSNKRVDADESASK